jgi:hypothetical protein
MRREGEVHKGWTYQSEKCTQVLAALVFCLKWQSL